MQPHDSILAYRDFLPNTINEQDLGYDADAEIERSIETLLATPDNVQKIDIYQFAENFAAVARLLEKLLNVRRQLWDLAARRDLACLQYIEQIRRIEAENNLAVASAFPGQEQAVRDACDARMRIHRQLVAAIESQHGISGGPLNFSEQIDKLRFTLRQDVAACFARSLALSTGASLVHRTFLPQPTPGKRLYANFASARYLDDMVAWYLELAKDIETTRATEATHQISIPLGTPIRQVFLSAAGQLYEQDCVLVPDLTDRVRRRQEITFAFSGSGPLPVGIVHYQSPASINSPVIDSVCITVSVPTDNEQQGWSFVVLLTPPEASTPVLIPTSSALGNGANWISDTAFINRRATGTWRLQFYSASTTRVGTSANDRQTWPVSDVQIHVRLNSGW